MVGPLTKQLLGCSWNCILWYVRVEQKVHERGFLCVGLWVYSIYVMNSLDYKNMFFSAKVLAKIMWTCLIWYCKHNINLLVYESYPKDPCLEFRLRWPCIVYIFYIAHMGLIIWWPQEVAQCCVGTLPEVSHQWRANPRRGSEGQISVDVWCGFWTFSGKIQKWPCNL